MIAENKLTDLQLELLKSFRHVTTETQLSEIKSLLNFYFRKQLDVAIDSEEQNRNYTAQVYEDWLKDSSK